MGEGGLTTRITDRRWKRALAANPASKKPKPFKPRRVAAVRVDSLVRRKVYKVHQ
jgi:hypothetical protein